MTHTLARRAQAISPSPTLSLDTKTKALIAQGHDVVNLTVGEPDFPTPLAASYAAIRAITEGFTRYTAPAGIVELRKAIAEKLAQENGLSYSPDEIIVSTGAKQSLYNIFMTLLDPGDEVLLPAPYWVSYPEQIRLAEGVPVVLETDEQSGFKVTPEQVLRAITPRTKAILINSPSNPTGVTYTPEEIDALAEALTSTSLYVVSDEIYEQLTYGVTHKSIATSSEELRKRTLVVNGFSKTFGMTGWRVGYVAGDRTLIQAMSSFQSHTTANPSSISQRAALGALGTFSPQTRETMRERLQFVTRALAELPGITCAQPNGAFYVFPNASSWITKTYTKMSGESIVIRDGDHLGELLLSEALISVVPGSGFGAPNNFRISYATSMPNLEKAMERLRDFAKRIAH
ncbi:pyridoxal phosphate-dependent aminotransferase [Ferroacidibacillus organovorans]|uniref:Aminotransferase n=1 Tax=Ferroacidibacillus organovorans TaxID=1765683 RepID=A0A162TYZ0_9BACL|nr:pyridoxal phosphate-dependent aminotransferase [Ferroacidibacillus organovorans]KYP81259.1 aspartate aminotransferase [Ferroacidibacillus organovorans]OAG93767.1 aspartate aminotransferase [Ferroacidibacillus organovorans]OPG16834.1 aspartate aminotransferase [Ferroacidibacillus organovorans]